MERVRAASERGVLVRCREAVDVMVAGLLLLLVLSPRGHCAPQIPESEGAERMAGSPVLTPANPFGSSEENRKLLQSYIKDNLNKGQASPDLNTWEQEVFFVFSLHDYDKSGQMDGLEAMQLLTDFLSHQSTAPKSAESVVSLVDYLLQTQDLNQDGMLDPSELLSPPMQQEEKERGQQEAESTQQDGGAEASDTDPEERLESEGKTEPEGNRDQPAEEQAEEEQAQASQNEIPESAQEHQNLEQAQEHQNPEQGEDHQVDGEQVQVPVHQGQPEM
ncbi:cell growth regulator with EF hand domain protein 1 isoform X2 [Chanos chanos]|uniref:Cell growth regulator with EF hand domain protein 1 isoform X2 n=1 Tax=Chanos chanos TaxID=29144 RepID=A0A6J2VPQ2_CHACN|nr:cell growth regulator with EF hand domain protein 1 isoform X2 [Chanos chanos]